jgi:hypothetical protein
MTCQRACNLVDSCDYFIYNLDQKNCELIEGTERDCDIVIGPPQPSYKQCQSGTDNTTTITPTVPTVPTTTPTVPTTTPTVPTVPTTTPTVPTTTPTVPTTTPTVPTTTPTVQTTSPTVPTTTPTVPTTTQTVPTTTPSPKTIRVLVIDAISGKVIKSAKLTSTWGATNEAIEYTDNKGLFVCLFVCFFFFVFFFVYNVAGLW